MGRVGLSSPQDSSGTLSKAPRPGAGPAKPQAAPQAAPGSAAAGTAACSPTSNGAHAQTPTQLQPEHSDEVRKEDEDASREAEEGELESPSKRARTTST
jgi:hypothetical protein